MSRLLAIGLAVAALLSAQSTIPTGGAGTPTIAANITQINGVAPSVGHGVADTGTLRVELPTDGTGKVNAAQSGVWTVTGTFFQATQPVSGTFWQATQPVSGAFWQATQPVSGTFWQATQPVSGTFWQATQPVSGTVTTTPPANQSVNQTQWNGTAVDTNSGTKSAGTVRVVLATDQPALTNKLLVKPDSVALPANQSVNVNQVGGTAADTNSGSKSAGTLRVVLATDQPALTNKLLVTPDSVALPANQSVNVNQINSVTPLMGNGATGTGSQRETLASDNTAIANWGHGATGGAAPAGATYMGGNGSGNLTGLITCDTSAFLDMTTATTTQIVALSSSKIVYVCSYAIEANGTTSAKFAYGTGSNCGTGTTQLTANWDLTAQTGVARGSGIGMLTKTIASNALCVTNSAAVNLHIDLTYTVF